MLFRARHKAYGEPDPISRPSPMDNGDIRTSVLAIRKGEAFRGRKNSRLSPPNRTPYKAGEFIRARKAEA